MCILSTPLLLGACGEGWEAQRTETVFPYGNQRTAGSGVVYVRAKMMPKKELNVEPVMEEIQQPLVEEEVQPVLDAEEIFTEAQTKGGVVAPVKKAQEPTPEAIVEEDDKAASVSDPVQDEVAEKIANKVLEEMEIKEESHSLEVQELSSHKVVEVETSKLSAEEYIAQSPKEISDVEFEAINIEPEAGGDVYSDDLEVVEIYENKVAEPIREIIVPKKDFFDFRSEGQLSLDEIYSDPLSDDNF